MVYYYYYIYFPISIEKKERANLANPVYSTGFGCACALPSADLCFFLIVMVVHVLNYSFPFVISFDNFYSHRLCFVNILGGNL